MDTTIVPPASRGFFPLDRALKVPAGAWSEAVAKAICRLGARMPYGQAAEDMAELTLVQVSPNSAQRLVQRYGTALVEAQQTEAQALLTRKEELPVPRPAERPKRRAASVDGTTLRTREAGWKEVKVGSVFDFTAVPDADTPDEYKTQAHDIGYCAWLGSVEDFEPLMWAEMERRQVPWAKTQVGVSDAGTWVRRVLNRTMPGGIHIVDWYHACERVWTVANELFGSGTAEAQEWGATAEKELWEGQLADVRSELQVLIAAGHTNEVLTEALTYFTNQADLMHYPEYRKLGYPIGSGTVESACGTIVGARCKQPGMRWSTSGANAILALRVELLSQRWHQSWLKARDYALNLPLN